MLNLFRKQPKGNPTKTVIIKHGGKSESTKQVPMKGEFAPQQATAGGFDSQPGRF